MKQIQTDVLVVGGGPAGSITAKYAAMGGADVLMIEKKPEIGMPVRCAEGIAKRWIGDVGIKLDRRWIACEVEGARVISPNGTEFCINERLAGNEVGTVLERHIFDKVLAEDAARAGADIKLRTAATSAIIENGKIVGVKAKEMGEPLEIR
ncbi:MAG: NAD(P)/FAD-dependent oxidoreductase, partial [Candidatus Thermoplasmatota archaeon]|nr:NAD(P)/FAD-dependent oxidoreductase [Candidatus Thermoplasmatota archaeon]